MVDCRSEQLVAADPRQPLGGGVRVDDAPLQIDHRDRDRRVVEHEPVPLFDAAHPGRVAGLVGHVVAHPQVGRA